MNHNTIFFTVVTAALVLAIWGATSYVVPVFRGEFEVQPDVFFGPVRIHFYGLFLALAILIGYWAILKFSRLFGISRSQVEGVFPWVVIFGFLGARFYYIAFSWEYYQNHLDDVLKIWQGGMAIYGGLLGGIIGAGIYAKRQKISLLKLLDVLALAAPLGQSLGRWGNFFNQEAFGKPTALPWKMFVGLDKRPMDFFHTQYFHPTFLYESLWDLSVFVFLLYLVRKSPRPGRTLLVYLGLYSVGRFFIEGLRLDSFFIHTWRVDQIVAILIIVATIIIYFLIRDHKTNQLENI